jgi:hypothetical protein
MAKDRKLLLKKLNEHIANLEHSFHGPISSEEERLFEAVVRNLRRVLAREKRNLAIH